MGAPFLPVFFFFCPPQSSPRPRRVNERPCAFVLLKQNDLPKSGRVATGGVGFQSLQLGVYCDFAQVSGNEYDGDVIIQPWLANLT